MSTEPTIKLPNSLEEHWMPFTANQDYKECPRLMTNASGMYYKDHHGNKLIDASSGLFCNLAGHSRKEIKEAVAKEEANELKTKLEEAGATVALK